MVKKELSVGAPTFKKTHKNTSSWKIFGSIGKQFFTFLYFLVDILLHDLTQ